jgi:hypothetical protein
MKRIVLILVAGVLVLSFGASTGVAQQRSLKEQLIGTWTMVSWEETRADGSKHVRFGANPKGVLSFDAEGRFITIQMRPDLPKVSSNDTESPSEAEAHALAVGSLAYFGTYTVNESDRTVSMLVEASTSVNLVGRANERIVTLISDKELRFRNPGSVAGGQVELVWKRE